MRESKLEQEIEQLSSRSQALSISSSELRSGIEQTEAGIIEAQSAFNALHRKRNEVDGQLESRQSSIAMMDTRQTNMGREVAQLKQQIKTDESQVRTLRGQMEGLIGEMAVLKDERDGLDAQRNELMESREKNNLGIYYC